MKRVLLAVLLLYSDFSWGHSRLINSGTLAPRSPSAGLKIAPCGGVFRTARSAVFTPGQTITVQWEETVDHPGRFEFYFSPANDADFVPLKTVPDNQDTGPVPHKYSTTLTLPSVPCAACTLQMVQVMLEDPDFPKNYYSCADIQLGAGNVGTGTTSPVVMPVPSDPVVDPCH